MTRTVATIEARMASSRLPGKVLAKAQGKPMLELMVERLRRVRALDGIVIATTVNPSDDAVAALAERLDVGCWRGSEDDVLDRVLRAAHSYDIDTIVELTGDCPLIDPATVEMVIDTFRDSGVAYCSNVLERTWPIGMDTQVFPRDVLDDVARRTDDPTDREHVSLYIYRHPELYRLNNVVAPAALARPDLRLTLDTQEDLALIRAVYDGLYEHSPCFDLSEIITFLDQHPAIACLNSNIAHRYV